MTTEECFEVGCPLEARWLVRRTGEAINRRDQARRWKTCGRHLPGFIRQAVQRGLFDAHVSVLPETVDE